LGSKSLDGFRTAEGGIAASLVALTTQKSRNRIADVRFRKAQLAAAQETLRVATEARRAWIDAVAAFEAASLIGQTLETADAASELAAELGKTGYLGRDDQAREHAFAAELSGQKAQADLAAKLAKEDLTRVLGLFGADLNFYVPNSLPGLPKIATRNSFEAEALAGRVDLAAAMLELEAIALEYRLTDRTRIVSDIALAAGTEIERELEDGEVHSAQVDSVDLEIAFEIPIFDNGAARLRKGEVAYMKAAHELAQKAVDVRSEARSAHIAWTGTHKIARHYRDTLLPLRKTIEEEALLSYNGMITNTFELLADTRARMQSNLLAASARRDFWLADANMTAVLYGGGSEMAAGGGGEAAAAEEPAGH
jgi:outer membrane protein TolC